MADAEKQTLLPKQYESGELYTTGEGATSAAENPSAEDDPTFRPVEVLPRSQSPIKSKPAKKRKNYRNKVECDWSQEQILNLISEIKMRRSLWDAGCAEYKMPKEAAWQEVADAVDMTLNECKGKWAHLRITFNSNLDKYRKKKLDQGAGDSVPITWKYFKPMLFLETKKAPQSSQSTSSMKLRSAVEDQACLIDLRSPSPLSSGQRRKRRISTSTLSPSPSDTTGDSSLKQLVVEVLQSIRSNRSNRCNCSGRSQPQNASTALCDYMASELQNLMPEQAKYARSKLRRTFNDIMDDAALIPSSLSSSSRNHSRSKN